jgi:hypothetical protein
LGKNLQKPEEEKSGQLIRFFSSKTKLDFALKQHWE